MKIFVVYNNNSKSAEIKELKKGLDKLQQLGHNIKEANELRQNANDVSISTTKKIEKSIKDCDILIAEVTNPDVQTGYNIARALNEKKIVIAFEKEGSKTTKTNVIHGNNSKFLIHKTYNNKDVIETMEKSIDEAKSKMDTKFILIISPEIDRYLEWASSTKRMHKAQIVRSAMIDMMKKDRQYKNYLAG